MKLISLSVYISSHDFSFSKTMKVFVPYAFRQRFFSSSSCLGKSFPPIQMEEKDNQNNSKRSQATIRLAFLSSLRFITKTHINYSHLEAPL